MSRCCVIASLGFIAMLWAMTFAQNSWASDNGETDKEGTKLEGDAAKTALIEAYTQQKANFDRLKTWQATVEGTILSGHNLSRLRGARLTKKADNGKKREGPGKSSEINLIAPSDLKATFVWDETSKSLLSTFKTTPSSICTDEATGDEYQRDTHEQNVRVLVKDDGLFTVHLRESILKGDDFDLFGERDGFEPPGKERKAPHLTVTREDPARLFQIRSYSYAFDPTVMFEVGGWRIDAATKDNSDGAVNPILNDVMSVKKAPNGDLTVTRLYRTTNDGKITTTHVTQLDSQFSFLPKSDTMTSNEGVLVQKIDWEYETVNGVIVPKTYMIEKREFSGRFALSRTCRLTDQKVNATLPADQFDVISLGLQDGDRIIDRIDERSFEIKNGKPVPF